jgi:hypothetical protein
LSLYYEDTEAGIKLYCGDCREVIPKLEGKLESIITDPIWPNASVVFRGSENPVALLRGMCDVLPIETQRLVIELGCDSDPRFLEAVPDRWPFLRVCWLEFAVPSYKGRLLYTGDVAYAFGVPPKYIKNRQLMLGVSYSSRADREFMRHGGKHRNKLFTRGGFTPGSFPTDKLSHPTPRRLEHSKFLVRQFSDEMVLDPFAGSGTTLIAAKLMGRKAIGIEIEEKFCAVAVKRLQRTQPTMFTEII